MELSSVQTAELHQQSMNQLGERLVRLESQSQVSTQCPVLGNSEAGTTTEEHGKRIQELRVWVQALNGGTSALVHPQSWENPSLGIQAEQKTEREGAEPALQPVPEPAPWTPKESSQTARKVRSVTYRNIGGEI